MTTDRNLWNLQPGYRPPQWLDYDRFEARPAFTTIVPDTDGEMTDTESYRTVREARLAHAKAVQDGLRPSAIFYTVYGFIPIAGGHWDALADCDTREEARERLAFAKRALWMALRGWIQAPRSLCEMTTYEILRATGSICYESRTEGLDRITFLRRID